MTRGEIIDFTKFAMNFNDSQLNDDVSDARWIQLTQFSYKNVWSRFSTQVAKASILTYSDFTWPTTSNLFDLPSTPVDLTNSVIYDVVGFNSASFSPTAFYDIPVQFLSRNTLTAPYNLTGNFRIYYIPDVEQLVVDTSVPQLIPPAHHEIICWEMLRTVKMFADKDIPQAWNDRMQELELNWIKGWSTRPLADRAGVINLDRPVLRPLA